MCRLQSKQTHLKIRQMAQKHHWKTAFVFSVIEYPFMTRSHFKNKFLFLALNKTLNRLIHKSAEQWHTLLFFYASFSIVGRLYYFNALTSYCWETLLFDSILSVVGRLIFWCWGEYHDKAFTSYLLLLVTLKFVLLGSIHQMIDQTHSSNHPIIYGYFNCTLSTDKVLNSW